MATWPLDPAGGSVGRVWPGAGWGECILVAGICWIIVSQNSAAALGDRRASQGILHATSMGMAHDEPAAPCRCGQDVESSFPSSQRASELWSKKKSMRSNKEQKHGCHFKMTSEFPSRLAPQSYLLRNRLLLLLLCRILNLLEKEKYQN